MDILIGLHVLRHLGFHTKTMLERDGMRLKGSDCSVISAPEKCGSVRRPMIYRHDNVIDNPTPVEEIP